MLARARLTCAAWVRSSSRDTRPSVGCYAAAGSIAFLVTVSGVFFVTGSISMLEIFDDWMMPGGSVATWMSLAVLDLVLLVVQEGRHSHSSSRSMRRAAERRGTRPRPPKSSYGAIPEKVRGRTYADTLMWRCAVPQRAGPQGGADGLDTKM